MRKALLLTSAIVAFALTTYACGSDDDTNGSSSSGGTSSSGTSGRTSSSSGQTSSGQTSSGNTSSGNTSSGSTSSSSSSSSSSGVTSGGTPPPDDAGSVGDGATITDSGTPDASESDGSAGTLCQVGSTQESEDNGSEATADELTGDNAKYCGTVGLLDTDYITFTLPVDASSVNIAASSTDAIQLEGTVDGKSFVIAGADAGTEFPFVAGGKYVLKATSTAVKSDYILAVTIKRSPAANTCKATSSKESEDNSTTPNTMTTATNDSSFCGTINTVSDVDKFKFQLPANANSFTYNYSATVNSGFKLVCVVDNTSTEITAANAPDMPFKKDMDYVCTATSTQANTGYLFELKTVP